MSPPAPFRSRLGAPSLWIVVFALLAYIGLGSVVELMHFTVGLIWSQAFLFVGPVLIGLRAASFRPLHFLRADRLPREKLLVLGVACSAFLCASALMGFVQALLPETWVKQFDLTEMLTQENGVWLYVGIIVGAPLAEEVVFRGCLLPSLAERLPIRVAVITQALLFSLIHFDPIGFLPRFILGIAFGLLWLDSGSLWAGVFAHALNNAVSSAIFLWFSPEPGGEVGGDSPWEAGLLACGGGIALTLFLLLLRRRAPPRPLPLSDPEALALPNRGGLFGSEELRGWLRIYAFAATGGLGVVALAARLRW